MSEADCPQSCGWVPSHHQDIRTHLWFHSGPSSACLPREGRELLAVRDVNPARVRREPHSRTPLPHPTPAHKHRSCHVIPASDSRPERGDPIQRGDLQDTFSHPGPLEHESGQLLPPCSGPSALPPGAAPLRAPGPPTASNLCCPWWPGHKRTQVFT